MNRFFRKFRVFRHKNGISRSFVLDWRAGDIISLRELVKYRMDTTADVRGIYVGIDFKSNRIILNTYDAHGTLTDVQKSLGIKTYHPYMIYCNISLDKRQGKRYTTYNEPLDCF